MGHLVGSLMVLWTLQSSINTQRFVERAGQLLQRCVYLPGKSRAASHYNGHRTYNMKFGRKSCSYPLKAHALHREQTSDHFCGSFLHRNKNSRQRRIGNDLLLYFWGNRATNRSNFASVILWEHLGGLYDMRRVPEVFVSFRISLIMLWSK